MRLIERFQRFSLRSLYRGDHAVESERSVENTDALAATGGRNLDPQQAGGHASFPPNYVKPDDGRPRH